MSDLIDDHPEQCVTAGELREAGAIIDSSIPDVAWVPRSAVRVSVGKTTLDPITQQIETTIRVQIAANCQWVEVDLVLR